MVHFSLLVLGTAVSSVPGDVKMEVPAFHTPTRHHLHHSDSRLPAFLLTQSSSVAAAPEPAILTVGASHGDHMLGSHSLGHKSHDLHGSQVPGP